jgi:SRSO17 transposase
MAPKISEMAVAARLEEFFDGIGTHLKDVRKRESFAMYAMGILGDGERKSTEPIAARACADPRAANNVHSKLLYFLAESRWDDRAVRFEAAKYALKAMQRKGSVVPWIVDDTGFLKQGTHSVGVQRQYTGSAGKVTNCQIGVSLCAATEHDHVPLDFELYLPQCWIEDQQRRSEAHIPDDVIFQTKVELALGMIERTVQAGLPGQVVLADSAYGDSTTFRNAVRYLWGLDFAVGVGPNLKVIKLNGRDRAIGRAIALGDLAARLTSKDFRKFTWRDGTNSPLSSRFCFMRVKTTHDDGIALQDRDPLWLLIEWPDSEPRPNKFSLTTLPAKMSKKQIIRLLKERWRTERMYEDLKGELGLDHFEGRSFTGWHHHVSVVMCCYAFVVAERARAFSPQTTGANTNHSINIAA